MRCAYDLSVLDDGYNFCSVSGDLSAPARQVLSQHLVTGGIVCRGSVLKRAVFLGGFLGPSFSCGLFSSFGRQLLLS